MTNLNTIEYMSDALVEKYLPWDKKMIEANLKYILTSVARFYKMQFALYAQGRNDLATVNVYRALAGLPPITAKENEKPVTWTLKSKHLINLDDQDESNDKSNAFDFAIINKGMPAWFLKVDTNESSGPDYKEAGLFWESVGGIWGGRWKKPDCPHCQV